MKAISSQPEKVQKLKKAFYNSLDVRSEKNLHSHSTVCMNKGHSLLVLHHFLELVEAVLDVPKPLAAALGRLGADPDSSIAAAEGAKNEGK